MAFFSGYRLGIDTTNNNLSLALCYNNTVLDYENIYPCSDSAEKLAIKTQTLLNKFSLTFNDITEIVSVTGPGGFSGVRIGTSFVTGLVAGRNIRVIAISSLQACAYSVKSPDPKSIIISCLNARRNAVYISVYDDQYQTLLPEMVCAVDMLSEHLKEYHKTPYYLSGHGFQFIHSILDPILNKADPIETSLAQEFTLKACLNNHKHSPVYFRDADATPIDRQKFLKI